MGLWHGRLSRRRCSRGRFAIPLCPFFRARVQCTATFKEMFHTCKQLHLSHSVACLLSVLFAAGCWYSSGADTVRGVWYRRDQLVPLQQAEGIDIRRRSDAFAEKVDSFVKFFQKRAPFSLPDPDLKLEHVRPGLPLLQHSTCPSCATADTACMVLVFDHCNIWSRLIASGSTNLGLQGLLVAIPCSAGLLATPVACQKAYMYSFICWVQAAPAYQVMDGFLEGGVDGYPSLNCLQKEASELRECQELFELYVSDYVSLARCRVSSPGRCTALPAHAFSDLPC